MTTAALELSAKRIELIKLILDDRIDLPMIEKILKYAKKLLKEREKEKIIQNNTDDK